MIYIKTLAIGLALFLFLRSASSIFHAITRKTEIRTAFLRIFPIIELLVWVAYVFWLIHHLFRNFTNYTILISSLIIVLILIIGWYLLRDFIAGIILKSENAFETGQSIKTPTIAGTIKKLGYRAIEILTTENELVKVPFTSLSHQNISKPVANPYIFEHTIKLTVPSNFQVEKIQDMLERRILEIPWILPGEDIRMNISRDDNNKFKVRINIQALSRELALKTEENLKIFVEEVFAG